VFLSQELIKKKQTPSFSLGLILKVQLQFLSSIYTC
jgi:hypothetical protein